MKQTLKVSIGISLLALLIFPAGVFAEVATARDQQSDQKKTIIEHREAQLAAQEERKSDLHDKMCENIASQADKITARVEDREVRYEERRTERLEKMETRRIERDETLDEHREEADESREEYYGNLENRAQTDEQEAAINEFIKTIEAAVDERRVTVDTIISEFRDGVDQAVSDHKTALDGLIDILNEDIKMAAETAKTACKNGDDPKEVRQAMREDMKAARDTYKEAKSEITKVGTGVSALAEVKRSEIDEAMNTFREVAETARETLQKAFE